MRKPSETNPARRPAPRPIEDPLAQLVDKFADEVEPVAVTPEAVGGETPTTSEGNSGPAA